MIVVDIGLNICLLQVQLSIIFWFSCLSRYQNYKGKGRECPVNGGVKWLQLDTAELVRAGAGGGEGNVQSFNDDNRKTCNRIEWLATATSPSHNSRSTDTEVCKVEELVTCHLDCETWRQRRLVVMSGCGYWIQNRYLLSTLSDASISSRW